MFLQGNISLFNMFSFAFVMTNFRFRNPSTGIPCTNWTPVKKNRNNSAISILKINSDVDIDLYDLDEDKQTGRISFWDSLGLNENEYYS